MDGRERTTTTPARRLGGLQASLVFLAAWPAQAAVDDAQVVDGSQVESPNGDVAGFSPTVAAPAVELGGYLDVGFADAEGDGTSFHPDDRRLPADYGVDAFAPAVNSRGDVASIETGGRFTNGFLPRSVGIGGRPSFLLNTASLDVRYGDPTGPMLLFARAQLLPRLDERGSATRVVLEHAFGRWAPLSSQELFLFVGKFDSVFGIEYLEKEAPHRTGITPSLIARYTTGSSVGAKLFYRAQLARSVVGAQPQPGRDQQRPLQRGVAAQRGEPDRSSGHDRTGWAMSSIFLAFRSSSERASFVARATTRAIPKPSSGRSGPTPGSPLTADGQRRDPGSGTRLRSGCRQDHRSGSPIHCLPLRGRRLLGAGGLRSALFPGSRSPGHRPGSAGTASR